MVPARRRAGRIVRRSEAIAHVKITCGGLYEWVLLDAPGTRGVTYCERRAAEEAREAWRALQA